MENMELPYDRCQRELQELLQAQYTLIFLRSPEESRAIHCVIAAYRSLSNLNIPEGELAQWSSMDGFKKLMTEGTWQSTASTPAGKGDPIAGQDDPIAHALNFLQERLQDQAGNNPDQQYIYILPDWSTLIEPSCHLNARKLKELVIAIEQKRPRPRMNLIIVGSDWSIPSILRNCVHILDLPLPIGEELYNHIFQKAVNKYNLPDDEAKRLSEQAKGMPLQSAGQTAQLITTRNLWSNSQTAGQLLLEVKKQEIRKTGVLEYFTPQGQGLQEVGGLEEVKNWISHRREWFEQDSNPELRPRALLLEGFPGCGKSFIAKAIAQEWRVPQINFEISRLQSQWVGESESNTFQALRAIEASAPNILFMDEIEKAFSGVGGDSSGVSTRQFGTFLSWLNDHNYPIFFIATSNDRSQLPPELFRAGRFDEIFIVMPPNTAERREIICKKAQHYRVTPISESTVEFLVEKTVGFSGAELDKLVKETIYLAGFGYLPNETHWEEAFAQIVPQYRTDRMQHLLCSYLHLLEQGGGKAASTLEPAFLKNLILPRTA